MTAGGKRSAYRDRPRRRIAGRGRRLATLIVFAMALADPLCAAASDAMALRPNVLALGVCPPWRAQAAELCKASVDAVLEALVLRNGIAPAGVHRVLNEGATAAGFKRKVNELANSLGPADSLYIYANLPIDAMPEVQSAREDGRVMEFWTDREPATSESAIAEGSWITTSAFAAMIHAIPAGEIVLLLDTSNSHAVDPGFLEHHAGNRHGRPEAVISAAAPGQTANYSADRSVALFAKHLALALGGPGDTLLDVVRAAASGTRQAAIPICNDLQSGLTASSDTLRNCAQVPVIHDPNHLLGRIKLQPLPAQTGGG